MSKNRESLLKCNQLLTDAVCLVCSKEFDRPTDGRWGYIRRPNCYKTFYFCSWSCIRKYDREKEEKERKKYDRSCD